MRTLAHQNARQDSRPVDNGCWWALTVSLWISSAVLETIIGRRLTIPARLKPSIRAPRKYTDHLCGPVQYWRNNAKSFRSTISLTVKSKPEHMPPSGLWPKQVWKAATSRRSASPCAGRVLRIRGRFVAFHFQRRRASTGGAWGKRVPRPTPTTQVCSKNTSGAVSSAPPRESVVVRSQVATTGHH